MASLKGSKAWNLIKMFAPLLITTLKPSLAPIAGNITDAMDEAEGMQGATGAQKLEHVKKMAASAADAVNTAKGHVVIDKSSLDQSVTEAVDTAVAVNNLVHKKTTGVS